MKKSDKILIPSKNQTRRSKDILAQNQKNPKQLSKEIFTTKDLQFLLSGMKLELDCGHHATIGHNFSNTVIILSEGGGRIKTLCHNCGY